MLWELKNNNNNTNTRNSIPTLAIFLLITVWLPIFVYSRYRFDGNLTASTDQILVTILQ